MKEDLIEYWKKNNIIKDERAIKAFQKVKRENFIPKEYLAEAYGDYPLPIGENQTISQPTTVMIMTQALEVKRGNKILEVGTGSGYQAALLSVLVGWRGKVYGVEIVSELVDYAKRNLKNYKNVVVIKGDGSMGYEKEAPYDRIVVSAACPRMPENLINQLKNNGILVAPVGSLYGQEMLKIKKKGKNLDVKNLGEFVFVPLKGKNGWD